ncbi:unnamed protein product, partial [Ectocarpus sp. 12 AP-2014]
MGRRGRTTNKTKSQGEKSCLRRSDDKRTHLLTRRTRSAPRGRPMIAPHFRALICIAWRITLLKGAAGGVVLFLPSRQELFCSAQSTPGHNLDRCVTHWFAFQSR